VSSVCSVSISSVSSVSWVRVYSWVRADSWVREMQWMIIVNDGESVVVLLSC